MHALVARLPFTQQAAYVALAHYYQVVEFKVLGLGSGARWVASVAVGHCHPLQPRLLASLRNLREFVSYHYSPIRGTLVSYVPSLKLTVPEP